MMGDQAAVPAPAERGGTGSASKAAIAITAIVFGASILFVSCRDDSTKPGSAGGSSRSLGGESYTVTSEDVRAAHSALAVLPRVERYAPTEKYSREKWKHWVDSDKDCQDTRQEVLVTESLGGVFFKDARGCGVRSGEWRDPYAGKRVVVPGELDIDHLVPLAAAHAAGGYLWGPDRRQAYANDLTNPDHLIAVDASANRAKGDKGPDEWLPPNTWARCWYVTAWIGVKRGWGLAVSTAERSAIEGYLSACGTGRIPNAPQR